VPPATPPRTRCSRELRSGWWSSCNEHIFLRCTAVRQLHSTWHCVRHEPQECGDRGDTHHTDSRKMRYDNISGTGVACERCARRVPRLGIRLPFGSPQLSDTPALNDGSETMSCFRIVLVQW
jgi:hypothetical protein